MSKKPKIKETASKAIPNNVILFPKERIVNLNEELSIKTIQENKELLRRIQIEETIEIVIPDMLNSIELMGFGISKRPELIKEIHLVVETVNSLLLKYYNIEHPLQETAEEVFKLTMEEKD